MHACILQNSVFSTRNLKNVYVYTVIPRFTSQLILKKGDINRKTTQIEVIGNKKLDEQNRNNVNQDDVIQGIAVHILDESQNMKNKIFLYFFN